MPEIGEQAAPSTKTSGNASAPAIPAVSAKSPSREEGELSTGEEAELLACSNDSFENTASGELVCMSSKENLSTSSRSGRSLIMTNQSLMRRNHQKNFTRKQVPFKFNGKRNFSWKKENTDDSLVISFSDDDSGSDSGKSDLGKNKERMIDEVVQDKSKLITPSVPAQFGLLQQGTHDGTSQVLKNKTGSHGSNLSIGDSNRGHSSSLENSLDKGDKRDTLLPMKTPLKSSSNQVRGQVQSGPAGITSQVLHFPFSVESLQPKESELPKILGTKSKKRCSGSESGYLDKISQEPRSNEYGSSGVPVKMADLALSQLRKRMKHNEPAEYGHTYSPLIEHSGFHKHIESSSSFGVRNTMDSYQNTKDNTGKDSHANAGNVYKQLKVARTGLLNKEFPAPSNSYQRKSNFSTSAQQEGKRDIIGDATFRNARCDKERFGAVTHPCNLSGHNGRDDNISGYERTSLQKVSPLRTEVLTSWDQNGNSKLGNMTFESLLHLEELQEKELEEAQELRLKCELDERSALKAYRKAQQALFEANERCAALHKKREIVSANLQALLLKSSTSLLPSSWGHSTENLMDSSKIAPNNSFDGLSRLGLSLPAKDQIVEHVNKSNSQYSDEELKDESYRQMNRLDSVYNQCSEPDDSTSECRDKFGNNSLRAHPSCGNISTDDDENNVMLDNRYVESRHILLSDQPQNSMEGSLVDNNGTARQQTIHNSLDYDLEASLRSKLVARFGTRTLKGSDIINTGFEVDETTKSNIHKQFSVSELQLDEEAGEPDSGAEISKISNELYNNTDYQESACFQKEFNSEVCKPVISLPSSLFRTVSTHLKFIVARSNCRNSTLKYDAYENANAEVGVIKAKSRHMSFEAGFSISDSRVDPFWPLCMYELRGKCNDEECCWQHVRSCKKRNMKQNVFLADLDSDSQLPQTLAYERVSDLPRHSDSLFLKLLSIPIYYIGSSLIKADSHLTQSVMARSVWQYWQMEFSASFPVPSSVQRFLPTDAPFLQVGDETITDYDSWNRRLLYYRYQDSLMKKLEQGLLDSEQSLEMALDLFSGRFCKPARKMALSILSRALEADPNSEVLWVVYLHLFYRKQDGTGKDDMFFHAVGHNGGSYDLWLMYINSRVRLADRLNAYNDALAALCQKKVSCEQEAEYKSRHVLDIFLQMVDFLAMSGCLDKFVGRIYGLLPNADFGSTPDCGFSGDKLLFDILCCLSIQDRSILLVSCVYTTIYGVLPKEVTNEFELEKHLPFGVQWPVVQLKSDKKSLTVALMEFSVGKLSSDIDSSLLRKDWNALRSLHFLVVSHVKCVAAVDGLQCSLELLLKYRKLYPTCIELVLLSEHLLDYRHGMEPGGFEYALQNWPKGSPGIQCIWNQYAERVLSKSTKNAEILMERWFQDFYEVGNSKCGNPEGAGDCFSRQSEDSELLSDEDSLSCAHTKLVDDMFKFLNLSLFKMLHNDVEEAYLAVDKALELATPQYYKHCLKEHSVLFLLKESKSLHDMQGVSFRRLLSTYIGDSRFLHKLETLSRKYLESIKKPRLKQLIDDILGPISVDFSTINSVLEEYHGPLFLPENGLKDFVGFVESVMEVTPANYQFALLVYKVIAGNYSSTDTITATVGSMFWASTLLVNSIFQANPVAPEDIWIEAASLLRNFDIQKVCERFHQQAVSVYPFSIQLWKLYRNLSELSGNSEIVAEAARKRGLELNSNPK